MRITTTVKKILSNYQDESAGVKRNLANILTSGKLAGTGKLVILPVDQGFEHGPDASFAQNPDAYDPEYHIKLAIDAGLSAYASTYGMLQTVADDYAGAIPLILKVNSSNLLYKGNPNQAITAAVKDAVNLGCSAIGFTIYPGADESLEMFEEIREMAREAKSYGLAVVIWSYPRGGGLTKQSETAVDVVSYAAHIAALLGAHIIKVNPPSEVIAKEKHKDVLAGKDLSTLSKRIAHIKQASFAGKRIVVFSGGSNKDRMGLLDEIRQINRGGGNGSIIGRNTFQRPREEALDLLSDIIDVYKNDS